jgi:hypothetical protein
MIWRGAFLLLAAMFAAQPAHAASFTVTAGCTSSEAGLTSTIPFTGPSLTDPAGHATYGGSGTFNGGSNPGCGGDWISQSNQLTTITFDEPIDYFGLAWGSKDSYNFVNLYNGNVHLFTLNGSGLEFATSYVNFFAGPGEQFTRVELSSASCCFETDNHSYRLVDTVPEPTVVGLMALGLGVLVARRRRHAPQR